MDGLSLILQDVSVKFPAGKIFVILSPEIGTGEAASSLLQQLSSQASQAVSGTIRVHGREVKDWNAAALHRRIAFLSVEENNFHLQAGNAPILLLACSKSFYWCKFFF